MELLHPKEEGELRELSLGAPGIAYVRDSLASGRELSKCLLKTVDPESGVVVTILPRAVTLEEATSFHVGGKVAQQEGRRTSRLPSMQPKLIDIIERILQSQADEFLVFEDAAARPNDPWIRETRLRTVFAGETVCYLLMPGDGRQVIEETVAKATSIRPPLIGVLAGGTTPSERRIHADTLLDIGYSTRALIIGAYDGEGFLVWTPKGRQ